MSKADELYRATCLDILGNGFYDTDLDMLTANNWNVCQYAMLLMMMAQVAGLKAGELVHVIADCHIYDRHIPAVKAMLEKEGYPAPKVTLDASITDFYGFTKDSFRVENYQFHPFDFENPIAI
ncbi:MAG: hypothetical protein IIX23_03010 [Oscillospiraceae bacterium]|nr:hypothetical protein [Oscillospiraceae bacterium]